MTSCPHLPAELWEHCISFVDTNSALAAVCRTSRLFHDIGRRHLYGHLTLFDRRLELDEKTKLLGLLCRTLLNDFELAARCRSLRLWLEDVDCVEYGVDRELPFDLVGELDESFSVNAMINQGLHL